MLRRLGFILVLALVLIAPGSTGSAAANPDPAGQANLLPLSGSSVAGTAFIRRLTNGDSHIMLRLTGLAPNSQLNWRILTGDTCGTPGTVLITSPTNSTASSTGVALAAATVATTVPVSAVGSPPLNVAVRVNRVLVLGGAPPLLPPTTVLLPVACATFYSIPDTGTRHSW